MPDFSKIEEVQHKIEALEIQKVQVEKDLASLIKQRDNILFEIRAASGVDFNPVSIVFSNGNVYRITNGQGNKNEITKEKTINLKSL